MEEDNDDTDYRFGYIDACADIETARMFLRDDRPLRALKHLREASDRHDPPVGE